MFWLIMVQVQDKWLIRNVHSCKRLISYTATYLHSQFDQWEGERERQGWFSQCAPHINISFLPCKIITFQNLHPLQLFSSHSPQIIMGRSPCCDKAHTNKGAWTKEEDQLLISYIKAHGEGCWRSLPKAAGYLSV